MGMHYNKCCQVLLDFSLSLTGVYHVVAHWLVSDETAELRLKFHLAASSKQLCKTVMMHHIFLL